MSLPKFSSSYFWDVDIKNLDIKKYPEFILERILEYGDPKTLTQIMEYFPKRVIKKIITSSRSLSPRSANFWAIILNINKNKIQCLKKSLRKRQNKIWLN